MYSYVYTCAYAYIYIDVYTYKPLYLRCFHIFMNVTTCVRL